VNPENYLKIKNKIPSNVNILAVSKGFKSQEIKTIQNIGQNDFGESKVQEAFEKQLTLKDLKQINWHFIGRIQSNKIRKIRNFIIEKNLNVDIEVDGGIKANWTISQCADAGANCFIAGSGMFAYPTLKEGCDDLRKVAQEAQKGNVLSEPQ